MKFIYLRHSQHENAKNIIMLYKLYIIYIEGINLCHNIYFGVFLISFNNKQIDIYI